MVELTDKTLIECNGYFDVVKTIMSKDAGKEWMLRTFAMITDGLNMYEYILHFWNNGDVYIIETTHPPRIDSSNEDIMKLSNWCRDHNWKNLYVQDSLIEDVQGFEFWNHQWQTGLIKNAKLEQREKEEIERFSKYMKEEEE